MNHPHITIHQTSEDCNRPHRIRFRREHKSSTTFFPKLHPAHRSTENKCSTSPVNRKPTPPNLPLTRSQQSLQLHKPISKTTILLDSTNNIHVYPPEPCSSTQTSFSQPPSSNVANHDPVPPNPSGPPNTATYQNTPSPTTPSTATTPPSTSSGKPISPQTCTTPTASPHPIYARNVVVTPLSVLNGRSLREPGMRGGRRRRCRRG
jgi:hypothetical protein